MHSTGAAGAAGRHPPARAPVNAAACMRSPSLTPACCYRRSLPRSWLLSHTHVTVGWLFNITFSLALVYASTWLVVNVAPEAGGAGVAEVMAYLNGCFMPKVRGREGGG